MGPHVFACGNEDVTDWFNSGGTASMGPHVFACGNLAHEAILDVAAALQWGRTFLRAEIWYERPRLRQCPELQWGRTFLRAEIGNARRVSRILGPALQWGRTFLRAEIPHRCRSPERSLRLQWGRTFLRAEMTWARPFADGRFRA